MERQPLETLDKRRNTAGLLAVLTLFCALAAGACGGSEATPDNPNTNGATPTVTSSPEPTATETPEPKDLREEGQKVVEITREAIEGLPESIEKENVEIGLEYFIENIDRVINYGASDSMPSNDAGQIAKDLATLACRYPDKAELGLAWEKHWQFVVWWATSTSRAEGVPEGTIRANLELRQGLHFQVPPGCEGILTPVSQ